MTTTTKPLSELVTDLGLTVKVMKANSKNKPEWAKQEWLILLSCDNRTMSFPYYGGGAISTPTITDAAYIMGVEYIDEELSFRDWASDYGYDTDSLKARRDYDAMVQRSAELEYLLGGRDNAHLLSESARDY